MPDRYQNSPELAAITRRFLQCTARRDGSTSGLFSQSSALLYLGSAEGELFTGDVLRRFFSETREELAVFRYEDIDIHAFERDVMGWSVWSATMVTPDTGTKIQFRGTIVFGLEEAQWKIVHIHNSNPVPNATSLGYDPGNFDELAKAAARDRPNLGQAGLATIMFTDIAESTLITETIGDTAWSDLVQNHVREIRTIVTGHGGELVKTLGDGTMSAFYGAGPALRAAQAIQERMAERKTEPPLHVRIGVHSGQVTEASGDFFGLVVNKAARIAGLAQPGDIRLSDATRALVGSRDFRFADPVTTPLKGLAGEHVIHRLEWRK